MTLHSITDDIEDDALMDCVDKLDARKLPIILKMAKESGGHVLLTEEGISVKFE